ncbi:Enterochelin esterase [Caulifigura coniformis]|uniref:Enterochelin esterase n=1 Tax=Caulifigura coniformis TaxID=2527983 RepID=A0A517S921_9PLAN|nr:alpha/beta hydrolase-fold protein [Caulifigura coniformis]QDT52634.1 Enterochelin esterase [Caulifigura coniformis]
MSWLSAVSGLILVSVLAVTGDLHAGDRLKVGSRVQGNLIDARPTSFDVDAGEGDYVKGTIRGDGLTLRLVDREGNPVRTLVRGSTSEQEFMFVAGALVPYRLDVSGRNDQSFQISIDLLTARQDQHTPPSSLESPRLQRLASSVDDPGAVEEFWQERRREGGPIVEYSDALPSLGKETALVTFLWRGAKRGVRLFGAPSNDHDDMSHLARTDVWYRSYQVPASARIGYKLAPDVPELDASATVRRRAILATAQRDPLNPKSFAADGAEDVFAGESLLELRDAPAAEWLTPPADAPRGEVTRHRLASTVLGNERNIFLYRPNDSRGDTANGLVVCFDGEKCVDEMQVPAVLDALIAAKKIPPTAAILIGNPSTQTRSAELPPNRAFISFLSEELMPWAASQKVSADASRTVLTGASYGGLAAAYYSLELPQLFGNASCQSGSFWWSPGSGPGREAGEPGWLNREFASRSRVPVKFYLEAGTFEVSQRSAGILPMTRHLRDVLTAKGYDVQYAEYAGGHGYVYWRHTFANGLIALLGRDERE